MTTICGLQCSCPIQTTTWIRTDAYRCKDAGLRGFLTTDHRLCQFKENGSLFTGKLALELERLVDFVSESGV
jgi:hypothetical protein